MDNRITGLHSRKAIADSLRVLESEGWIERTKVGGLHRYRNFYGLTGKHDGMV